MEENNLFDMYSTDQQSEQSWLIPSVWPIWRVHPKKLTVEYVWYYMISKSSGLIIYSFNHIPPFFLRMQMSNRSNTQLVSSVHSLDLYVLFVSMTIHEHLNMDN